MADFNQQVIDEFPQRRRGRGPFEGAPVLLLQTVVARSGAARTSPMTYQQVGDAGAIFTSKAGASDNPVCSDNLIAQPEVVIEVGTSPVEVRACEVEGDDRESIWSAQKVVYPAFGGNEVATGQNMANVRRCPPRRQL